MFKRKNESTEEDRMKRLIICKLCHETLEDPIILPCGETICSIHLINETSIFKCGLCDKFHNKIADKFRVNETVCGLLQICDNYVDLNSIDLLIMNQIKKSLVIILIARFILYSSN